MAGGDSNRALKDGVAFVTETQFEELLQQGITVDQLNVVECKVFETFAARYQRWEEFYSSLLEQHVASRLAKESSALKEPFSGHKEKHLAGGLPAGGADDGADGPGRGR